jgi:uncharacterized protein (DUF488 family)
MGQSGTVEMKFFTIGVYGTTRESFFGALIEHKITHFCDIRQRRGMRGHQYSYANATALRNELEKMGMEYRHVVDLAPTHAIRDMQLKADKKLGMTGSNREKLTPEFAAAYRSQILSKFDIAEFVNGFPRSARVVLFCVEETASACHRSLVAEQIAVRMKSKVDDITP